MIGLVSRLFFLQVRESYQGGKIAYILQNDDPGYDANFQHGLIAATSDQNTDIHWFHGSYTTTRVTGTALGTGLANTNATISSQGATAGSYIMLLGSAQLKVLLREGLLVMIGIYLARIS